MIRLLHVADVHLGAPLASFGALAETRRAGLLAAFQRLPELAAAEGADAVLIAGDLFDGAHPPVELVAAARETLRRLLADGRPVFAVPGNHDAALTPGSPYRTPLGGAHVFLEPVFTEPVSVETRGGPLHVYGLAYDRARAPEPLRTFRRAPVSGAHVVVLHGCLPGPAHWASPANGLTLPPDELAQLEADYIALGDQHRFASPAEFDALGRIPACYAGSFAGLDRSETGRRGYVVVELEGDRRRLAHRSAGMPEVVALDVDVTAADGEAEVADAVSARCPEGAVPVVRLTGTPGFPLDAEIVRAHVAARHGHAWATDETRYVAAARLDELARQDTIAGHVVRLGRQRIEAAADAGARATHEQALRIALVELGVR